MSIYPHRNAKGRLTGKFRVEVQRLGKRLKGLADTIPAAEALEKALEARLESGEGTERPAYRDEPKSLLDLLERGKGPLWTGPGKSAEHLANCVSQVTRAAEVIDSRWRSKSRRSGSKPLVEIDTGDIDALADYLKNVRKLAPGTINRNLSAVHTLLSWASKPGREWVKTLPEFDWQDEPEYTLRLIKPDEQVALINLLKSYARSEATADRVADFVEIDLATGLRLSELLERQPDDLYQAIDLNTKKMRWWLKVENTKTKRPRSVPLTDDHAALLKSRLPWGLYEHNVRYWWDKARADMGLTASKRFVRHAMRHTYGTAAIAAGVNPFVLKPQLGHARIETTLRYVHVNDEMQAAAGDATVAFMERQKNVVAQTSAVPPEEDGRGADATKA